VTRPLHLTVVCEPPEPPERYERFRAGLERHAGAPVVVQDRLRDVHPSAGFVLLSALYDLPSLLVPFAAEERATLLERLVLFTSGPREALAEAERFGLAGAIDELSFLGWPAGARSARGPTGLRSVAAAMGVECAARFGGERYCLLRSDAHEGLPHLLVDYLRAYERR
jgi:hypothetical protein